MTELIPNWMKRYQQQDLDEEKEDLMQTPVKLLDPKGRNFIWWLCKQYKFMSDGVMGQACSLLERYMSKKFKSYSYLSQRNTEWRQIKQELANRIPLLASVCIGLTTKMMSSEIQLHATAIKTVLICLDVNTSLSMINAAELDVLSTLGFCIPMFTNVEKALMMAVDVGMSGVCLEGVALVTEVAEYYRAVVQEDVIAVAFSMRKDKNNLIRRHEIANVRHIHLVAGSIIAAARYLMYPGPDPVPRLCFLTQSSSVYIKCIGDLIHKRLVTDCRMYEEPSTRKRKLSLD